MTANQIFGMPDLCLAFADASPMPMAGVDGHDHIVRYVNPAFCSVVSKTARELLGSGFAECLGAGDDCMSLLDRVYRTGHAETHIGAEDSSPRWYRSCVMWPFLGIDGLRAGTMIQVTETAASHRKATAMNQALLIGSVLQHELTAAAETLNAQLQAEIVHRKHAEEELVSRQREIQASERQYRGLIEAIPQIVWTATPEGILDFANSKWSECLGIDLATFNRAGWSALLHPLDIELSLEAWAKGIESRSVFQIEHRLKNFLTGEFRWYLSRAVPVGSEDESLVKWFGTFTDVEDQKRAEMSMYTKQKLESLGLLAGGIAHDFNNLLCVILGEASMVADALPVTDPLQSSIGGIVSASERAAHLTRQMLAYAGKGQFLVEQIDVGELVRSTCELVKASIPRSVDLTLQTLRDLPPVDGDSGQMQQVVMNLVLNAAEAIDPSKSGSIMVKMDSVRLAAARIEKIELAIGSLTPGPYVVVEIQDNGSGMDEITKERIFDPFFTTKFTGRGLGLAAVGGILNGQHGALELRSALGSGSTFRVYLPASASLQRARKPPVKPFQDGGAGTVLVVEDEEMVRRTIQLSLEYGGFTVRIATDGEDAIEILQNMADNPISLVLLDSSMPGMSGKQVIQQMRVLGIEVPVLICSGYSEKEVYREFSGFDIVGVMQKPFTARQLANRVSLVLHPEKQQP